LKQKGRTTACDTAIGSPSTVGTRAGNQIEKRITDMNSIDAPTGYYSQVVVPYGSKKHCESTTPLENRGDGKLDLVAVVDRTPERVTIEIIEVKPLTPSGLPAGEHDIYDCYAGVVADAGSKCNDDPVPAPYVQFCDTLDADGAEVVLADPEGGFLDPLMNFEYADESGTKHPMKVVTCMPGVFAYQCVN
jgi:hypothetical protein